MLILKLTNLFELAPEFDDQKLLLLLLLLFNIWVDIFYYYNLNWHVTSNIFYYKKKKTVRQVNIFHPTLNCNDQFWRKVEKIEDQFDTVKKVRDQFDIKCQMLRIKKVFKPTNNNKSIIQIFTVNLDNSWAYS